MGARVFQRSMARRMYADFCDRWRREKSLAGLRGKPGYKRPTFAQWYAMHGKDHGMMAESAPQDVQEYLGLDPWAEETPEELAKTVEEVLEAERGVTTINVAGDDDE